MPELFRKSTGPSLAGALGHPHLALARSPIKMTMKIVLIAVVAVIVVVAVFLFSPLGERPLSALFSIGDFESVNFEDISLTDKPNQFLMCPPGVCTGHADSPVFDASVDELRQHWDEVVATQPRVELVPEDGQQFDYVQRSARFRFPDIITVRFITVSPSQSTLAIYSRSVFGKSDFGVNRKRIEAWLSAIGGSHMSDLGDEL